MNLFVNYFTANLSLANYKHLTFIKDKFQGMGTWLFLNYFALQNSPKYFVPLYFEPIETQYGW